MKVEKTCKRKEKQRARILFEYILFPSIFPAQVFFLFIIFREEQTVL